MNLAVTAFTAAGLSLVNVAVSGVRRCARGRDVASRTVLPYSASESRLSDGQAAVRIGLRPWASGRIWYREYARLAQLGGINHRTAANIVQQGVLRGFEPDEASEDVKQTEQVVVERPGPASGIDLVQRGGSRTATRVLETVPDPLVDYSHAAHTVSPDRCRYRTNLPRRADANGLSLFVVQDRVGHVLGRIRDGAEDSRTVVFRTPRGGQLMWREIGVCRGEHMERDDLAA